MRSFIIKALSVCFVFGSFNQSLARAPKDSDLTELIEFENLDYDVKKNGTYSVEYSTQISVLTEAGRENQSVRKVTFNDRASKFELISAMTINDGVEIKVRADQVQIKEVGESKAFDTMKEAIISFPSVRIGSKIAFRYRLKVKEVAIENFFSMALWIGMQNIDSLRHTIRSEIPLFVRTKENQSLFDIQMKTEGRTSTVTISNREKVRLGLVHEDNVFMSSERLPLVLVSTSQDWKNFGVDIIRHIEDELKKPLPAMFEEIRAAVQNEPSSRRMALVSAKISEKIRYFGDWRRRNGGQLPRSLQEIAESGYGDCKDVSLAVVAIARKLGLKADIAWLWRGDATMAEAQYSIPNEVGFNHAVARVEDGPGPDRVKWIDATNLIALARGTLTDIAERPALIMSAGGAYLDRTPELKSQDSVVRLEMIGGLKKERYARERGLFEFRGSLFQGGRLAYQAAYALLYAPAEQVQYETTKWLARGERLDSYDFSLPKEVSRVASDVRFDLRLAFSDYGMTTTAGFAVPLTKTDLVDMLLSETRERVSDIWLGAPGIVEEKMTIVGASLVGHEKIGCDLKNDWARLSRTLGASRNGIAVRTRYEILKSTIPNEALQTAGFAKFQREVRRCFNRSAIVLSFPHLSSVDSKASKPN